MTYELNQEEERRIMKDVKSALWRTLFLGFALGIGIGSEVKSCQYERTINRMHQEKIEQAERPKSYFEMIQPQSTRGGRFGEVIVRTDLNKDGLWDLEEVYVQQSPMVPVEVNVREGIESNLELTYVNALKIKDLKSRKVLKIRDAAYFGNPY
jgi:hypothetical protein